MNVSNWSLVERLQDIRRRIAEAERHSGRAAGSVRLIGASKGVDAEALREAVEAGLTCFGENRAQELKVKVAELARLLAMVNWGDFHQENRWPGGRMREHPCTPTVVGHFIGHLQKNKVRDVVPLVSWIHSVDSIELALEIERQAAFLGKEVNVLIQVNLSGESTKHGVSAQEAEKLAEGMLTLPHVKLQGFMTLPPFFEDPEKARPFFRSLRELRDRLSQSLGLPLPELSMGMSHDFEIAVEEGATIVRIGSALFGPRS